jgi:hypothetical protein
LRDEINEQKRMAEESGKVSITEKETFDASIPRVSEKKVLSKVDDYKKHYRDRRESSGSKNRSNKSLN